MTGTHALVNFEGVLAAMAAVEAHLPPTPAWNYPLLDAAAGVRVVVKHENTQPTGAFKIRGGVNLAARLSESERTAGLVTASTGNHAQSVAFAGQISGTPVVVVMPKNAPTRKVQATRALGADVVLEGSSMSEALQHAHALSDSQGMRYVDPGNEPDIIHGHATVYLELLRQHPDLEAIYVPIGSGSGAAGACIVRDALAPNCEIIGVQSEAAPAAFESWTSREIRSVPSATQYSGLATGRGFELPQSILSAGLSRFILVPEDAIQRSISLLATAAHTLAEGAGAASLAGLMTDDARPHLCAIACTGGNADAGELSALAENL